MCILRYVDIHVFSTIPRKENPQHICLLFARHLWLFSPFECCIQPTRLSISIHERPLFHQVEFRFVVSGRPPSQTINCSLQIISVPFLASGVRQVSSALVYVLHGQSWHPIYYLIYISLYIYIYMYSIYVYMWYIYNMYICTIYISTWSPRHLLRFFFRSLPPL